jgi:hypothetical protein
MSHGGTLVVGDVHGCADELDALLQRVGPARLVVVGDLFTRGPRPGAVWELLAAAGAVGVLGNHDARVLAEPLRWAPHLPDAAIDWLRSLPLWREEAGVHVIHAGVDPLRGPAGTPRATALTVRRWPRDGRGSPDPFWWEGHRGPRLVVYGHDAARGLVDRRPYTLGLDTGCVYGGALTGYLVEADRLVQVPARAVYRAPEG